MTEHKRNYAEFLQFAFTLSWQSNLYLKEYFLLIRWCTNYSSNNDNQVRKAKPQSETTSMESVLEHLLKQHAPPPYKITHIYTHHHHILSRNLQQFNSITSKLTCNLFLQLPWPLQSSAYQLCHPDWLHFDTSFEATFLPPNRSMFCQWHFWLHSCSKCEEQLHRHWNNYFSEDILLYWKRIILACFIEKKVSSCLALNKLP